MSFSFSFFLFSIIDRCYLYIVTSFFIPFVRASFVVWFFLFFFFKKKTAYEWRISDWSSDVCSSDLVATTISGQGAIGDGHPLALGVVGSNGGVIETREVLMAADLVFFVGCRAGSVTTERWRFPEPGRTRILHLDSDPQVIGASYPTEVALVRSEEHTSELQSLMR